MCLFRVYAAPVTGRACLVLFTTGLAHVLAVCTLMYVQVYVHVDESLHGMEVIKAFDAVNYFIQVVC